VLSLRKPPNPFYSKDFLDALFELDLQSDKSKLYNGSLDTLLLKKEGNKLLPVGDRNYVDYRSISDKKRNAVIVLLESEYKNIFIDSVRFDEVQALQINIIRSNLSVDLIKGDVSVLLEVPKTYEDYLSNLGKKKRHELKRKLNKFKNEFPEYEVSCGDDKNHFLNYIDLHIKSSKEKKEFMTEDVENFFSRLLKIKGWKIYLLWINKKAVASYFCFENREAIYLYNSGKNIDFNEYSVGIFLTHYLISKSIKEKKKVFDFLKGAERYKFDLGGKPQQLYDIKLNKI
jgi:predicted N-acyltransferase